MYLMRQIAPAMLTAWAIGLALLWPVGRIAVVPWRVLVAGCALATAYLGGSWVLDGRPRFPPGEAIDWLVPLAFGASVLASAVESWPVWSRFLMVSAASAFLWSRLLICPLPGYTNDGSVFWMAVFGFCASAIWMALAVTAKCRGPEHARDNVRTSAIGLVLSAVGAGVALMLSGSQRLGELSMVVAGVGATGLLIGGGLWPGGALLVPVWLLFALLVSGCFYADLPLSSAVLLGAAPASVRISRGVWRIALQLALIGLAVLVAYQYSPPLEV